MRKQENPEDAAIRERICRLVSERSQSEVARKTGAQVAAVNRYVHGARVPASFCSALVRGLGVNPSWLLMGEGSPYLADVPARTAALGENMLELVEAMSAVSRMLIGSLAGKHHLVVLRELNQALLSHERLREDLNKQTRPVFERILGDFEQALNKRDLERADDLRKAADQLSRICDDEKLTRDYLRVSAFHDFQLKNSTDFLQTQRKLFLRSLPDGDLFDERACDEARRIVVALVQMQRMGEALRIVRAVRALAGRQGKDWQAWARLENTYAVLLADKGELYRGIELIQRTLPKLSGMYRTVSEAALIRMLMWSNVLSLEDAMNIGTPNDARASHLVQVASWNLSAEQLKSALEYAESPSVEPVWGKSVHGMIARYMLQQLTRAKSSRTDEFKAEFNKLFGPPDTLPGTFVLCNACCELERVGKRTKQALAYLWQANDALNEIYPEMAPDPLDLATHYRAALALIKQPKTERETKLIKNARRFFKRRIKGGYLCFEGVAEEPGRIPRVG